MNFHRYYIPGAAVFITQVVAGREPVFSDPTRAELLLSTLDIVKVLHPFSLLAYCVLPDHFHMILQPNGGENFSQIMHSLKPNYSKAYKSSIGLGSSQHLKFWQKRFWDHVIRDDRDLENHLHYVHYNPVKHGLTADPRDWPYNSYRVWEERGLYPEAFQWEEPRGCNWGE